MKHLSREELVDSLDGVLTPPRQAHVESCSRCRAERDALASVMREMSRVDMPEPSPLFWDHLSARVRESLEHEPAPAPASAGPGLVAWLSGHWAWSAVTVALCVIVGGIGYQQMRMPIASTVVTRPSTPGTVASNAGVETRLDPKSTGVARAPRVPQGQLAANADARAVIRPATVVDDDWNLMMRVAEEIPWDDDGASTDTAVNGLTIVRPETADAVVRELTADERRELVRLLHEEMTRPPSS